MCGFGRNCLNRKQVGVWSGRAFLCFHSNIARSSLNDIHSSAVRHTRLLAYALASAALAPSAPQPLRLRLRLRLPPGPCGHQPRRHCPTSPRPLCSHSFPCIAAEMHVPCTGQSAYKRPVKLISQARVQGANGGNSPSSLCISNHTSTLRAAAMLKSGSRQ